MDPSRHGDESSHRTEMFKLSRDPLFVDNVRDVGGLYLAPPDRALVLCVDEKSQSQALDRMAPILPMTFGSPERRTHDYRRHGTTSRSFCSSWRRSTLACPLISTCI
jgi:hypothetical protein